VDDSCKGEVGSCLVVGGGVRRRGSGRGLLGRGGRGGPLKGSFFSPGGGRKPFVLEGFIPKLRKGLSRERHCHFHWYSLALGGQGEKVLRLGWLLLGVAQILTSRPTPYCLDGLS